MEQKNLEKFLVYFIGVVAFFVVFVAIKQVAYTSLLPGIFGSLGAIFTIWRFTKRSNKNPFVELFNVFKDDYAFDKYAFLSLASLIFASAQGACLGAALGSSVDWVHALVNQQGNASIYLSAIGVSFISFIGIRVLLELYSVFFKAALDIRTYVNRK